MEKYKPTIILVSLFALQMFMTMVYAQHAKSDRDSSESRQGFVLKPGEGEDTIFVPVGTDHKITSSDANPLHVIFIVDRPGLDEQFRMEFQGLDRTKMTIAEFNAVVEKYGTVYKSFD